jgi:hypothetical protein
MKITDDILTKELDATEKDIELEKYKTALKKAKFIQEIKSGLGQEIKNNPNKITIITKPWYQKVLQFVKKIFTKF